MMIDALLSGRLAADPKPGTSRNGNPYATAFVVSLNLHRRHLSASQLAFVALEIERVEAELAKKRQGTRMDLVTQIAQGSAQNASQLAFVALEIERVEAEAAKKRQSAAGGDKRSLVEQIPQAVEVADRGRARDRAAEAVGVNSKYVTDAKRKAMEGG